MADGTEPMTLTRLLADATLHGNGEACPACALRREVEDQGAILRPHVPCNVCGGVGRLGFGDAEICRRTVEEAWRIYWPEVERRWREGAAA